MELIVDEKQQLANGIRAQRPDTDPTVDALKETCGSGFSVLCSRYLLGRK